MERTDMGIVRQMIEQHTPPPAVEKALKGLDEAIKGKVPPIWIEPMANWAGYCADYSFESEIKLSDTACGARFDPGSAALARATRSTILHEYAHRLLGQGYGHNGAFAAMRLTLALRATNLPDPGEHPDWWSVKLYDVQDHLDDPLITMPQALAWAWSVAQELAPTSQTADECAAAIKTRWAKFTDAQEHRAEREEQRKIQQKQSARDMAQEAEREKRTHTQDKLFLGFVALIGWAVAIIAVMH
ncbi:hypothetical protein HF289_08630 [Acidithiobacillus ferrooxidans]|uniref:hypothetical protein n=1 Tax=Acidithiobacillus ferrooxidans TaxID=920 RepID=UPI001C064D78|nr:hypothetical protein [Acidithiobacillus ferrooxidans]MBU2856935.1 hypothetical protein [Acidithiobacillus ferrooxidans]